MTTKKYAINYHCKRNRSWLTLGWFDTEAQAEKYASELVRDYPEVLDRYVIVYDLF